MKLSGRVCVCGGGCVCVCVCVCSYFKMFAGMEGEHVVHVEKGQVMKVARQIDQPVLRHTPQELQHRTPSHLVDIA